MHEMIEGCILPGTEVEKGSWSLVCSVVHLLKYGNLGSNAPIQLQPLIRPSISQQQLQRVFNHLLELSNPLTTNRAIYNLVIK